MALTTQEAVAIERNLFPLVRPLVQEQPNFPWHQDRSGKPTAGRPGSSQALAVDFFGTVDRLPSRDAIVDAWVRHSELTFPEGGWKIALELTVPTHLLGETRPTQLDALATGRGGLIAFEGKFTEQDGGACSQTKPLAKGAHHGAKQCNGNYAHQTNPVNQVPSRCALSGKHIKYWDLVPEVMNFDASVDHSPCPFKGPWFQWMRNLVAAHALGRSLGKRSACVVVYADGPFPMATKVKEPAWRQLEQAVAGRTVPLRTISYQTLLAVAHQSALAADRPVLHELDQWITAKMDSARLHGATLDDDSGPFLSQLRNQDILSSADWEKIMEWLGDAVSFLEERNETVSVDPEGDLVINFDADPRNADWLRIVRVYRLTGYRLPGWAALWLWWLGHDRGQEFWSAVTRVASNANCEKMPREG